MPSTKRKKKKPGVYRPPLPPCAIISRGGVPVEKRDPLLNLKQNRPPANPEEQQAMRDQGVLLAALYARLGSVRGVAEAFGVTTATVRYWIAEARKLDTSSASLQAVGVRLKANIAQLAVDRVEEGLMDGDLEFAADLGTKVLKGLGELKSHATVKNDGPAPVASLTLNIVRSDPIPVPDQIAGAVVGQPYDEKTAAAPEVLDAELAE